MKKQLSCLFLLVLFNVVSYGQAPANSSATKSPYQYYIFISGVNTKADILALEKNIGAREGVTYFMADRFPERYFLLRSSRPVSKETFATWIDQRSYKVQSFGEGDRAREQSILASRKKY